MLALLMATLSDICNLLSREDHNQYHKDMIILLIIQSLFTSHCYYRSRTKQGFSEGILEE